MTRTFDNPILPGFHPDPSICRVGEDYYLVTSTFEYFPGLPIFHSRDLVHWRQLGHVLDRPEQLPLDGVRSSGGLYAPTLRHADGVFYLVCTLVDGTAESGNFVVTATDPAGPWSQPVWWTQTHGIDPSLFFDDDGRAWALGQRQRVDGDYPGDCEIWLRELDRDTLLPTGPESVLWQGAVRGAIWPEGPHLYRIDGTYYLLCAEGGTGHEHAVTVARSDAVTGPYVGNPANPVLTHRHLRREHPIVGPGHADLIDTPDGQWWAVLLAMRPYGGYFYNLGRETFLVPVQWSQGWPLFSAETGRVESSYPAPELPETRWPVEPACDHFDAPELAARWMLLRTPRENAFSLDERPGHLRLRLRPQTLADADHPSFVARRQQHVDFHVRVAMDFAPRAEGESAGLALVQNTGHHLTILVTGPADRRLRADRRIRLVRRVGDVDDVLCEQPLPGEGRVFLSVTAHGQAYACRFATEPEAWQDLGAPVDGRFLSTPVAGGFVGTCIGMYATSDGRSSGNVADFDWFEYKGG